MAELVPTRGRRSVADAAEVDLETPVAVVDLDLLAENIRRMQDSITACGVKLRPHVKTHKIPEIAQMQLRAGAAGISVAKVGEAEVFARNGCEDIFIAYPVIGPSKWRRIAELALERRILVGVDSEMGARGLSAAAQKTGATIGIRVKVDSGLHRVGVQPDQVERLCRLVLTLRGLQLDGIFTFRSIFFEGSGDHDAERLGLDEGQVMAGLAGRLREAGVQLGEVSAGSTPTARYAAQIPGVTEVRPGTYVFGDYMQAAFGALSLDQVALQIQCTVVSRQAADRAVIDGGSKTFCGDIYPANIGLKGYAKVVGQEAYVVSMTEEHGVVQLGDNFQPKVGDRLFLHPIHVCTAVNLCDQLIGMRAGKVEKVWDVLARGKRT